ncbi:MAG: hypothetical protein AB7Y46_19355 [Armatimonadota bacterium]
MSRAMIVTSASLLALILAAAALAQQAANVLANGDFEAATAVTPGADGLYQGWRLSDPALVPAGWSLNSHYVGALQVRSDGAHSGRGYLRISASERGAHIFQIRDDLQVERWYRISARIRGGPAVIYAYEYFTDRQMNVPTIAQGVGPADEWVELSGYWRPGGEHFRNAGPAIAVPAGQVVDIDDVRLEVLAVPAAAELGPEIVLESALARMIISAAGRLTSLQDLASGEELAAVDAPLDMFTVTRAGMTVPVHSLTQEGDVVRVQFLDPQVRARIRAQAREGHFFFEVLEIAPDDVASFSIQLPVLRRENVAPAFNATYDDRFGLTLFGTTINTFNAGTDHGATIRALRCSAVARHGIAGAGFAFVAAPRERFNEAIMAAERAHGLPCPMLDGQWARFSDMARASYLFATGTTEADIDTLIEYAKLGGFGTIIILKNDWLATHGHYDINTERYPDGLDSVKRFVDKVHAAGLTAGVHLFGPSISPNDPYVTPVPHDGLAYAPCPPLAEGIDETATTITVAAQPELLPPAAPRSRAFPGYYLRIGDEIIQYAGEEVGPPFRYVGCTRGALGSTAAAHPAGAQVRAMLNQWGFFLVDPDSELAEEVTDNFAAVANYCGFDMIYFDASDGTMGPALDGWYYLNRMHLGYYSKLDHDVLYQTSTGTGSNILWHIIPRSASADGHGDIKGYLDQRWPGILGQARNFTRSDIGWYYMFSNVRPDQIEYVRAKALSIGASISIECSRASLEALPQARRTFEMLARYERCRLAGSLPADVLTAMQEPGHDFRLFESADGFQIYRAVYEEPRTVDALDGGVNVWHIVNDRDEPCDLAVEIVAGPRRVAYAGYEDPAALTIESFEELADYAPGEHNQYEQYVSGARKEITATGVAMAGVTQEHALSDEAKVGGAALAYSAENTSPEQGWTGIGRRFDPPLDLSAYAGIGLWIRGDEGYEKLRVQLRDTEGHYVDQVVDIDFSGWSLHTFPLQGQNFDASGVEYLLFYFNNIPARQAVSILIDEVRALPDLSAGASLQRPALVVNGIRTQFPVTLEAGQALTTNPAEGTMLWPVGMQAGQPVQADLSALRLQPGENTVVLEADGQFPGDVSVLVYRMWELRR